MFLGLQGFRVKSVKSCSSYQWSVWFRLPLSVCLCPQLMTLGWWRCRWQPVTRSSLTQWCLSIRPAPCPHCLLHNTTGSHWTVRESRSASDLSLSLSLSLPLLCIALLPSLSLSFSLTLSSVSNSCIESPSLEIELILDFYDIHECMLLGTHGSCDWLHNED